MTDAIVKAMHDLTRSLWGIREPKLGTYRVYLRASHGDVWTAQGELPIGEPCQYVSGDIAVVVDFNDGEAPR